MPVMKLDPHEALRLLKRLEGDDGDDDDKGPDGPSLPKDVQILRLQEAFRQLRERHMFEPGDIVRAKPGLYGALKFPLRGQPAVITKLHTPPLIDAKTEHTSPDFGRKFDVAIRMFVDDNRILEFPYDSELLEPYPDGDA